MRDLIERKMSDFERIGLRAMKKAKEREARDPDQPWWAFGYIEGDYEGVKQKANSQRLRPKNIKESKAGMYWRPRKSIMRISGLKSKVVAFYNNNENRFVVFKEGMGPAPSSP